MGDGRRVTAWLAWSRRKCDPHCRCCRRHGCWCWWMMGDGQWVMVVVVIAVRVYNNNFSFSTVFVTIRGNKSTYLPARGRNAPEPTIVVVVAVAVVATAGSVGRAVCEGAVGGRESASEMVRVGSRCGCQQGKGALLTKARHAHPKFFSKSNCGWVASLESADSALPPLACPLLVNKTSS